jgi:hypothetical protein
MSILGRMLPDLDRHLRRQAAQRVGGAPENRCWNVTEVLTIVLKQLVPSRPQARGGH